VASFTCGAFWPIGCGRLSVIRAFRDEPYDAIVPIPLHPTRLREREFNQALAIGEIFAQRTAVSQNIYQRTLDCL
jgi:predicted amidophosphoribosyltransferase